MNYNLAPRRGVEQIDFIRQRTTEARTLKRDDVNVMCSWVVTLPEYRHHNQNLHVSPDKEQVERLFFERTYRFLCDRYGEQNVISAYVHKDEKTPHMHFAFVPVTEDEYAGVRKLAVPTFPLPLGRGGELRSSVRTLGGYRVANPVPRRAQVLDGEAVKPY